MQECWKLNREKETLWWLGQNYVNHICDWAGTARRKTACDLYSLKVQQQSNTFYCNSTEVQFKHSNKNKVENPEHPLHDGRVEIVWRERKSGFFTIQKKNPACLWESIERSKPIDKRSFLWTQEYPGHAFKVTFSYKLHVSTFSFLFLLEFLLRATYGLVFISRASHGLIFHLILRIPKV